MAGLDREHILAMKRQLEEEFRLDMAALDRLERRFTGSRDAGYAAAPPVTSNVSVLETRNSAPRAEVKADQVVQPEPDELEGTLRTMFSNYRK